MPTVNVNDADIFYEMVGSGPAIVYVHGGYGGASSTVAPREEPVSYTHLTLQTSDLV